MKKAKYLNGFGVLIKDTTQTIENETKKQRDGFLGMLLSL